LYRRERSEREGKVRFCSCIDREKKNLDILPLYRSEREEKFRYFADREHRRKI